MKNIRKRIAIALAAGLLVTAQLACKMNSGAPTPDALIPDGQARGGSAPGSDAPQTGTVEPIPTPASETTSATFHAGEPANVGNFTVLVTGWQELAGTDYTKPSQGFRFVSVEVVIVNAGSASEYLSYGQLNLKDNENFLYEVDTDATVITENGNVSGELAPGEKIRGTLGYRVRRAAGGFQLIAGSDMRNSETIPIALNPDPGNIEPPAKLPGEQPQLINPAGQPVTIENLTITVHDTTTETNHPIFTPPEGKTYLLVDVTIENNGTQEEFIAPLLQMYLKTNEGFKYSNDILATTAGGVEDNQVSGQLQPGNKIRGWVGFLVPQDAGELVLVFDPGIVSTGKVMLQLP